MIRNGRRVTISVIMIEKVKNKIKITRTNLDSNPDPKAHVPSGPLPNPSWYTPFSVQRPEFRLHWGFWDLLTWDFITTAP